MLTEFGPYLIIAELGRGYAGAVFQAQNQDTGVVVALKVLIEPMGLPDAKRRERFQREARSLSAITHPAIPRLYESGVMDGYHYMVREFFPGKTLRQQLDQKKRFPPAEATGIITQLLSALQVIHEQGIIHRDIKPENLILQDDGSLRILDFGCAHDDFEESLTRTGEIIGSPAYMSPEQIRGKTVDARSDLFAVGILLHELLSGQRPFAGEHPLDLLRSLESGSPQIAPAITGNLRAVILRAIAKSPTERFANAAEMRQAIEGKWQTSPTAATAPAKATTSDTTFAPVTRTSRDIVRGILRWVPALLLLALLGGAGFFVYQFMKSYAAIVNKSVKSVEADAAKRAAQTNAITESSTRKSRNSYLGARNTGTISRSTGQSTVSPRGKTTSYSNTSLGQTTSNSATSPRIYVAGNERAPATTRPACPTCNGSGSEPHPNCNGSGDCPDCNGKGHRNDKCSECRGAGVSQCAHCQGSGFQQAMQRSCNNCNGTGKAKCFLCGGKGHPKCAMCSGTGKDPLCNGKGKYSCPICNGRGTQ
jgi:serine/threonine protein kinase